MYTQTTCRKQNTKWAW